MARSMRERTEKRAKDAKTGKLFKSPLLEITFPRHTLLMRQINRYFDACDEEKKHYSLPGLGLFLGVRTRALQNYVPSGPDFEKHGLALDYAKQRIEAYIAERLFENKGSTRGTEFLLQNTLGYANKSDVNSKQELEITEKDRIAQLDDKEVKNRLKAVNDKIVKFVGK